MAGPDAYKEFDNSSIVTTSTNKDSFTFGRYSFRKRDLLLGGIAIVALIIIIILAAVLAVKSSDDDSCDKNTATNAATSDERLPYCVTVECLKAATYQKPIMKPEINPCEDFYSFACGHYDMHHPQTQFLVDVTPKNEILFENTENIVYLLGDDVKNNHIHSYERKLKDFMKSCENHFDKMDLRGRPLLNKIITPLGGWYVLDTFDEGKFDFNDLLRKIHIDFWADPFFTLSTRTDQTNWNHRIVEFTVAGTRLSSFLYVDSPFAQPIHQVYKSYISLIAQLLTIDSGFSPNSTKITTFVNDVFEMESAVANVLFSVSRLVDNHQPENRVTLAELEADTNHTIDFVTFMKTLFNEWPSHFEPDTKVAIAAVNYYNQIGELISSHLGSSEGKRKLHNYMMWQVIEPYVRDLSWDYVHAKRKLIHLLYGVKDESSGYLYCFNVAEAVFAEAMSAVYVKEHIKDEGKIEASSILDRIKDTLMDRLRKATWLKDGDWQEAVDKIKNSLYKIGFPDYLADDGYMDNYYYHVSISDSDYFGNILAGKRMHQKQLNDAIGKTDFKTIWSYHVFDPQIEYYNPWHELIMTAAMLQNPLFDAKGPAYYNYGGIGSRLATNLIHAIDEIGSLYKLDGSHFGTWWSNMTMQHYEDIKQCAIRKQRTEDFGDFKDTAGIKVNLNVSIYESAWAPEILSDSSGVRIAYQAFKDHEKGAKEKLPPGFQNYDTDKMFFISYAQSFCRNRPDYVKTSQTYRGILPNKNKVNMAMKSIPEFTAAFKCPNRPASEQCLLFGK